MRSMLQVTIRTKLLVICIVLVLLTTTSISTAYYILIKQDKHQESRQRIQIAFEIILDDMTAQLNRYSQRFSEFFQRDTTLYMAVRIKNQDRSQVGSKQYLISQLINLAHITAADRLFLYDTDKQLLAQYDSQESGIREEREEGTSASDALLSFAESIPEKITARLFSRGNEIGFQVITPLAQENDVAGVLVGEFLLTQNVVERYAALSKTAINFFANDRWSLGTLPAQTHFEAQAIPRLMACRYIPARAQGVEVFPVNFGEQSYYQGYCALKNSQTPVGVITVSLSQAIEKQAIRKLLTIVVLVSLGVSALAVGVTAVFTRQPIRFIQQLITYIERLSRGDIPAKITRDCKGEFHDIKQNLNRLIEATSSTARLAEDVAAGNLNTEVWERSDQDRLMKAMNAMIRRLTRFSHEMDKLVQAVNAGELSRRGDTTLFFGGWRDLVSGVNNVIDAFVEMIQHNERLKAENLRMGAELDISRRIQQMVLPPAEELGQIEGLDVTGIMQPAEEIGGDYYDILTSNGTVHIGIGDVTGHGLESGIVMLMTQTAIRTLIEYGETDPVVFLTAVNRVLRKNIQRMQVDRTMTLACLNYQQGTLKLVGQHEEVLVVRKNASVERLDTVELGFPLGLTDGIDKWLACATVTLEPGDGIVLYTDGITEAENPEGEMYGLERLCDAVSRHWTGRAEAVQQAVIADVTAFIGTQKVLDDLTLVVLKQQTSAT